MRAFCLASPFICNESKKATLVFFSGITNSSDNETHEEKNNTETLTKLLYRANYFLFACSKYLDVSAKRIQSDVISLIIMTENEDETLKRDEWKYGRKWETEEREKKNSRRKHQQILNDIRRMLLHYCNSGMKILWAQTWWNRNIFARSNATQQLCCWAREREMYQPGGKAVKVNRISNASEHLWQQCCDKAWNLYRKSAEDALGHAIRINSVELNANTNIRRNFFLDILR